MNRSTAALALVILVSGQALAQDTVIVNEVMVNPWAVLDIDGEWFEVLNVSDITIDINGWTIKDEGSDLHTIDNGGPLLIAAGAVLVLGINGDPAENGGAPVDYEYTGHRLSNGSDEIILLNATGAEVDRLAYHSGFGPRGVSKELHLRGRSAAGNDILGRWCNAVSTFGDGAALGTPGRENDCGALVPIEVVSWGTVKARY